MNILLQGSMLKKGLEQAGHRVFVIPDGVEHDILVRVRECGVPVDIVLVELFGRTSIPENLHRCPTRLAAWCVDSTINEFWLSEICRLFDDVFVDQAGTLENFKNAGIPCRWLPLFAQDSWFRMPRKKDNDLVFVGSVSPFRPKRANLLAFLRKRFSPVIRCGLSMDATQDLFAASRVVLNENLFDGLTQRVFQGLASGSLVLTEPGNGMERLFRDGRHLVVYGPDDIVEIIEGLLDDPGRCAAIAEQGQERCRERHTERMRAAELVAALDDGKVRGRRLAPDAALFHETRARYRLILRHGGFFRDTVEAFSTLAAGDGEIAARARFELGGIAARTGNAARAHAMYAASSAGGYAVFPHLASALLHLRAGESDAARRSVARGIAEAGPERASAFIPFLKALPTAEPSDVLHIVARVHEAFGMAIAVGFQKSFRDVVPETAFEIARLAWEWRKLPRHMELMLDIAARHGVADAPLPDCLDGLREGALTDRQLARTAELARIRYDFDTARTITDALRIARRDGGA